MPKHGENILGEGSPRIRSLLRSEKTHRDNYRELGKVLSDKRAPKPHDSDHSDFCIPAGITYLAQMMAHDLILTVPSGGDKECFQNLVRRPLMMDALYGTGPTSSPHLYLAEPRRQPRTKFPENAIKGTSAPDFARSESQTPHCRRGDAIIADRRNDSHTIIAQMTAVWMRFHNHLVGNLNNEHLGEAYLSSSEERRRRFEIAQRIVRRTWHNVLENDVLRFILTKEDCRIKSRDGKPKYKPFRTEFPSGAARIALRCLHTLPLPKYKLKKIDERKDLSEIITIGSEDSGLILLDSNWSIDWSLFFDIDENHAINRTKYELKFAEGLVRKNDSEILFSADIARSMKIIRSGNKTNLVRNSIKSVSTKKRVRELTRRVKQEFDKFNSSKRPEAKKALHILATKPPLQLLLLHEAEIDCCGAHLGKYGSALLAPWLMGALRTARESTTLTESQNELAKESFVDILKQLKLT